MALETEPGGRFWATPPKPEMRNEQMELYGALVDAAGKVVARSESQIVPVTGDCKVELGAQGARRRREPDRRRDLAEAAGEESAGVPLRRRGDPHQFAQASAAPTRSAGPASSPGGSARRSCSPAVAGIIGVVVTDQRPRALPLAPIAVPSAALVTFYVRAALLSAGARRRLARHERLPVRSPPLLQILIRSREETA